MIDEIDQIERRLVAAAKMLSDQSEQISKLHVHNRILEEEITQYRLKTEKVDN